MTNEPYTEETAGQIDPQNPFENALENAAYRTDYRRFLPQILLPDFHISLFPEREERSRIRRQMNTAGAGALLGCMGSQLLFPLTIMVLLLCMDGTAASYFNGDQSGAIHTMESSGIYMALHCLIFGGMNTLVAWLGCRRIRQPLGGLFRTTDFSGWKAFQYICIGFALQQLSVVLYAVTKLLHLELPEASFDYFQSTQSMLLALLYTCVLAPVTEELLFRGFLMKSLSAVSVRFGIVTSALLFGLMHGNFQQFILGFVMGLFLGKIVARHNSLLPSILVHMAVNTNSMVLSLLQEKLPEKVANVGILPFGMAVLAFSIMGVLFWLLYERRQPLPYPTQKQATRSRTAMFSPVLVLAVVMLAGFMVFLAVRGANG